VLGAGMYGRLVSQQQRSGGANWAETARCIDFQITKYWLASPPGCIGSEQPFKPRRRARDDA